jgi:hypothetical protein
VRNLSKSSLIFFSLLGIHQLLCETPPYTLAPTYNYNPTMQPHFDVHITNSSAFSVKIGDITLQCIQKIQETITRENYQLLKNNLCTALWEYRYQLTAGACATAYFTTIATLLIDYYYHLQDNAVWANWKHECSFEDLCNIPHKDLTHELLCAINTQYYNKEKPTDGAHPLMIFIGTITHEIAVCKRYIKIANTLKQLRIAFLFPVSEAKINHVNKLLERTLFIKHLFLSWLAEYNIKALPVGSAT